MTNPIARYDCTCQEGHMAAEPAGEYVRYDDIKHLLQVEPTAGRCPKCGGPEGWHSMACGQRLAISAKSIREGMMAAVHENYEPPVHVCTFTGPNGCDSVSPYKCRFADPDGKSRPCYCQCHGSTMKPPADRKSALDEIVRISEEAGLYNEPSGDGLARQCDKLTEQLARAQKAITSAMDALSNGRTDDGARILRECFWLGERQ